MRYSVTGTVDAGTIEHYKHVDHVLATLEDATELTTGGAFGVDTIVATMAWKYHVAGAIHLRVLLPKGCYHNLDAKNWAHEVIYVPGGYMKRNDALVATCDVLLAFPKTASEELRSGTWATVRRGRKAGKEIRVYPLDGSQCWQEVVDSVGIYVRSDL